MVSCSLLAKVVKQRFPDTVEDSVLAENRSMSAERIDYAEVSPGKPD